MAAMVGAASAAPAVIQQRDMSSMDVVYAIKNITKLSTDLRVVVESTNVNVLVVLNPGSIKPITDGFQAIINLVIKDIQNMKDNPMVPPAQDGQIAICTAFREFVVVHQNLLAVVIGKSGILQSLGGGPIAAILRALEKVVDTIAFGIIDLVPFCAAGAKDDANSLTLKIQEAECAYTPAGPLGLTATCKVFQTLSS